jgi:hypothetical protein
LYDQSQCVGITKNLICSSAGRIKISEITSDDAAFVTVVLALLVAPDITSDMRMDLKNTQFFVTQLLWIRTAISLVAIILFVRELI